MPDNGSGVHSLPPGYQAVTGQTIEASQHNPPLEDLSAGLTARLSRNGAAPMLGPLNMAGSKIIGLGTPTLDADAATKSYIDAAIASVLAQVVSIPPGTISLFAGDSPPPGWFACTGSAVSRTTYAALFTAIGTKYGAGDGSTTFNLPDTRGEFPRFADLGRGVDPGRVNGTAQGFMVQSHGHGVNDPSHTHGFPDNSTWTSGPGGFANGASGGITSDQPRSTFPAVTGITIQAFGGTETRPRNIALIGIIKA